MHSFFRLRGYGLAVVPFAPCVVRRVGAGTDGRIAIEHDEQLLVLDPRVSDDGAETAAVADVQSSGHTGEWVIDFGPDTVAWPNHFAVASSDLAGVPFEWWGDDGASIMVQGPFSPMPEETAMAAPGQTIAATGEADGCRWVELHYEVDGDSWAQRHTILPDGLIVSAQACRRDARGVWSAADGLKHALL